MAKIIKYNKTKKIKKIKNKNKVINKYFFTFRDTKFFYSQKDKDMLIELHKNGYNEMNIKVCKKILLKTRWLFNTFKIPFYLIFGTLLGAIREKNFIKHDNDLDIAILDTYSKDLCALLKSKMFKKCGFKLSKAIDNKIAFTEGGEFIDIFIYAKHGNKYKCFTPWTTYYDPLPFFDNPSTIKFLGKNFQTVQDPSKYLSLHYGRDWRTPKKNKHAFF